MNFTAGHFIDSKGLGISFRIGSVLYAIGMLGFCFINYGYHWVLIGAILIALGQPLVMNCPAKVATFWFVDRNVPIYPFILENRGYRHNQWNQSNNFGRQSSISSHIRQIGQHRRRRQRANI